ncbi:MAG: hypothetical protein KF802_09905 [Bdellovibrionaceae bacterium]|nr:hypothetical protein [Pseudobdellovibrionaceae bacterium]
MEGLNPALNLALTVRRSLEGGESTRAGLQAFAREKGELAVFCRRWLERRDRGADHMALLRELPSMHRRTLFIVFERGLRGEPIHEALCDAEKEVLEACRLEMDRHLALLPFRMMIPLLLFLFPAVLLLILAPFLDILSTGFAP